MIKILIVEDDDSIAGLMRMTLCKNGYHVETAPDGLAAARAVESAAYDLLLLDVMLPGLDGFELMDYLQEYQIPVIFITAPRRRGRSGEGPADGGGRLYCQTLRSFRVSCPGGGRAPPVS